MNKDKKTFVNLFPVNKDKKKIVNRQEMCFLNRKQTGFIKNIHELVGCIYNLEASHYTFGMIQKQ